MARLRLITFDVTGTLLTFRTPVLEQYAAVAEKFHLRTEPRQLQVNFKTAWKSLATQHPNFGRDSIGWQSWWQRIVVNTFNGADGNIALKTQIADDLIEHFKTAEAWGVSEGAHSVLKDLMSRDKMLGIISNFDPRLHTILENLDLKKYFAFVLTSYEVGIEKPDAGIFQRALEMASVKAFEALHVGNDKKLDYDAAISNGLQAILISGEEDFPREVASLNEVIRCVDRIDSETSKRAQ